MGTLAMIRRHSALSGDEVALLNDPAAPIVLLRAGGDRLPGALAPGLAHLGWMLPYTPLHHLLLDAFGGPLVMTSGNLSGEPQVIGNAEARQKLGHFADAFLMHDRAIARRLDDSVERITPQGPMILRRARGRVPGTLPLPDGFGNAPQIAAYGGQMKGAICLIKANQALLGHHLGDLDDALSFDAFLQADADYADLFDHRPDIVACDLHPDFQVTRHAESRGLPVVRVQHHHAHLAACLGENGWPIDGGPVAGIILDGLGLGTDGTIWGGEILLGDYRDFERRHWLQPAPLIGGDRAQMEPWRNALARLDAADLAEAADRLFADAPRALARQAVRAGVNTPLSSSAGRLFDAAAACLGICSMGQSYEAEAAMRLEALADRAGPVPGCGFGVDGAAGAIDPAPMFRDLVAGVQAGRDPAWIAAMVHAGVARGFAERAAALVASGEARAVALSGGCFQNLRLLTETLNALGDVPVLIHRTSWRSAAGTPTRSSATGSTS
jgi:hydrogenase maturation protein HypF